MERQLHSIRINKVNGCRTAILRKYAHHFRDLCLVQQLWIGKAMYMRVFHFTTPREHQKSGQCTVRTPGEEHKHPPYGTQGQPSKPLMLFREYKGLASSNLYIKRHLGVIQVHTRTCSLHNKLTEALIDLLRREREALLRAPSVHLKC